MNFQACSWCGQDAASDSLCAADIIRCHPAGMEGVIRRSIIHGLVICRYKTAASAERGGQKPQKILWKRIQNEVAFTGHKKLSSRSCSYLWKGLVMEHFYPDQVTACL